MLTENQSLSPSPLFRINLECKYNIFNKWLIIVKNGKFNDAKIYLQKNPNLKINLKIQVIDEKRTHIKQEKYSQEITLKDNFIIFNNEKISL